MIAPQTIIQDHPDLLPDIRDLYSRHPEMRHLAPYELQWPLFALGYCEDLADEAEIAAVLEVLQIEGEVHP
jgi:hypothetical protein